MILLLLVPLFFLIRPLSKGSIGDAFINVCLPVMVFIPMEYAIVVPHLLNLNAHDLVLLPVAAASLIRYGRDWRLTRCDFFLLLFMLGEAYANGRDSFTQGLRAFFLSMLTVAVPYVIGKLLIEKEGIRERFLRRFCWLMAVVAVISLVEFFSGKNLFTLFFGTLFSMPQVNPEQTRGGFTRIQGPFGHAIVAGLLYSAMWIFALWLGHRDRLRLGSSEKNFLGVRRSNILIALVFMGLITAHSRGPWMGAALSFGIWLIARAKNVVSTTIVVAILGSIVATAVFIYLDAYTSGTPQNIDQQNAIYRRELLDVYKVIADDGGIFGWGKDFPRVAYRSSVDNQYLLVRLTGGYVGLWTFNLIAFETCLAMFLKARRGVDKEEFTFWITMLAVCCGTLLTLGTVALDVGTRELFFLLAGWSFSIQFKRTESTTVQAETTRPYRFQRIIA